MLTIHLYVNRMKCPNCDHVAVEEKAKFCSQCGTPLSAKPPEQTQSILSKETPDESTQSEVIPQATEPVMTTETNTDSSVLPQSQSPLTSVSPKRPNDNSPNVKKKKKKKKKKRKSSEKDRGPLSLTSDLSDISLTDKDTGKTQEEAMSSDSEESVCPMDETPDLAESQISISPGSSLISPSEEKTGDPMMLEGPLPEVDANENLASGEQGEKGCPEPGEMQDQKSQCDEEPTHQDSDSSLPTASETLKQEQTGDQKKPKHEVQKDVSMPSKRDESPKSQSQKDESKKSQSQKDESKKSQSQKDESKKSQSQKDTSSNKTQSQKDSSNKMQNQKDALNKTQNQKDSSNKTQSQKDSSNKTQSQKDSSNKTQSQKDASSKTQPVLDQNANVDQSANANAGSGTQKPKSQEEKKSEMVFGPRSKPEVKSLSSSVDPQPKEDLQPLQSARGKGDTLSGQKSPESKKQNKREETDTRKDCPPERVPTSTQQLSSKERLIIYFHAVLSKDFKFDPNEDRIFIRAGPQISDWDTNLVELTVTRDLKEHGFLVEGSLVSTKEKAEAESIPYKYVVYKNKKGKYEYEYIYKLDSSETTNRCLFVKRQLLNAEGEWHQYDDIICIEPSKSMFKRLKENFWPEQRKSVIEGREIAGRVMLETIFDFLTSWTDINLRNFITQLKQFHQIYGNPFVFEEKGKKWLTLNYTEKDVSKLLKNFMIEHITPELQKDGSSKKKLYVPPQTMTDTLTFIQGQLLEQKYRCFSDDYGRNCLGAAVKLLEKICKGTKYSYMHSYADIPTACLNLVVSVSDLAQSFSQQEIQEKDLSQKAIENSSKIIEILSMALKTVRTWIGQTFKGKLLQSYTLNTNFTSEIEMWNNIISIRFESEEFTKEWRDTFTRDFEGKFQQESPIDQIEVYCSKIEDLNNSHPYVARSADEKLIDQLSEEAKERLAMATSLFTNISDQLIRGSIRIKVLNHILAKKDIFTELVKIDCLCENIKCKDSNAMRRLLQSREDEVKAIYHDSELVKGLIAMCRNIQEHITVDFDSLDAKSQVDIDEMELNKFMEVHQFDQIPSTAAGVVTYFDLDADVRDMAETLHTFKESYIFKICWESQAEDYARRASTECESDDEEELWATIDLVYEDIFQPCYNKYRKIYKNLKDGSMTFEKVDLIFKAYIGKYEELAEDATIMAKVDPADDKRWIQRRIQQIEQYHELHLAVESAQVVLQVKQTLGLQGDFQVLEKLLIVTDLNFKKEHLDSIDNELMQAKTVLVDITEPRRLCLQELGLRKNFVLWVKEALEDINELKVFVDLASISAGENDLDVDRVACFHDAVLGYSSMLYELKSDTSFRVFKECDTARHLEWLKTVKDSHGSVELSSLSLASAINTKGIYFINAESQKKLSLDNVLKLRIPEEHDEGHEMRCYSLDDLKDLQNKLMLMSGKGEQGQNEVDRFVEVQKGLHEFLFRLLVLGYLMDSEGRMWKCSSRHLYIIELLQSCANAPRSGPRSGVNVQSAFQDVFPVVFCRTPKEVLELEVRRLEDPTTTVDDDPLMDDKEFRSEAYQRPYQYLKRFHHGNNLDGFMYRGIEGTHMECIQLLFFYCGVMDPSWAELRNFTWFLNLQLKDCETSVFCDASFTGDTLLGFKNFVVDFMILMAKDFATPSLSISDQSPGRQQIDISGVNEEDLAPFRVRKRWESEPHPYIFFNDDHVSMTFIGFHLQPNDQNWVDAIDPSTNRVIKKNIMTMDLYEGLRLQRVPFNIDFDSLPRGEKIERLCNVLGIQWPLDPDETYELTTDNILKILAIHMRFRCGIPVIIMGETGCGKTRLIKFLCELRRSGVATENMKLVKVHGGTSSDMIYTKVREAESIACSNKQDYGFDSVLFFDEANTTEAISCIKEVLCDKTCSPHSTPEGIINTFKQCARFQEGKNLSEYISVVVLDEIGLAEDSPKMPLKTLHPLLEEGCIDDQPLPHKKVGFIGISNWALDPAKMNRGIFVSRGDPDEKELIESAKGICSSDAMILEKVRDFFQPFARAYLKICKEEGKGFFGLRDYYSLIKMLFAIAKASDQKPSADQIVEAVLRNFSGKDTVNCVTVFTGRLGCKPNLESIDTIELVRQNITAIAQDEECRYLLILTKNYAALQILQQTFFSEQYQPEIIFGSSFPKDQQYTQICRNINRVKICMETGQTVVLLNLQNLYESLYDALNQYYVCLGGQKYVDLGLGTHRVKCRVHKDFRLIVIEEKEVVYKQFPIPLINRLEKHYLDINTVLKNEQKQLVKMLEKWVGHFIKSNIILQVMERQKGEMELSDPERRLLDEAKLILLNCVTPDAMVTTFSRLLTASDIGQLQEVVPNIELLALQQFDTEHSFLKKIRNFLDSTSGNKILIIQTEFDEAFQSSNLIASAKYSSIGEINKFRKDQESEVFVYFITKLPRVEGGTSYVGFHGGPWKSVHIDDLRRSKDIISDIKALQCLTISQLFEEKEDKPEAMETEDMYRDGEDEAEKMEQEDNISWENVLDTTALVRSCVQSAVGMLQDQGDAGCRSTRRVEILLTLLSDSEELQVTFLKTIKRRLHALLMNHDEHNLSAKNWVFKEASNIDSLQEGGTFRNTLWKRVQAAVIPFLAQLVSVIDRDRNLDILLDENSGESVKKLWLDIFGNVKFLNVPYARVDSNSVTKTILVQNSIVVHRNTGCLMPFSWIIKDHLEELWVHALHREGHTLKQFEEFFWKTPLGRYIAEAKQEMQEEFFYRYLQDFISLTTTITTEVELELLVGALTCCVNELRFREEAVRNDVTSFTWVHAAYHEFKNRLQNFSRMITIEPQIAQVLLDKAESRVGMEMVLDVYAAMACVEYLEPQGLHAFTNFEAWLRQVKKLQVPVELVCSEESIRHYGERSKTLISHVQLGWRRIHALSLFVEHMLLGIEDVEKGLKPLVLEHTRRLAQVLQKNSDLKMKQPFEAVITILKTCKDGANDRIFRFGFQPCPVCMGDPHDPLSLPCEHIYCLACIKQWLIPGQMYCPLCMHVVDDDFDLKPSEFIRTLIKKNGRFRKQCNAFFIDLVSTICFRDNSPPNKAIILHLLSFLMVEAGSVPSIRGCDRRFLTKALSPFDDAVDKNPVVRSVVLKLLLKYSFADVKGYLQKHLTGVEQSNILENADKTELYCLYINCLEDSMFERTQWHSVAEQQACLLEEKNFLMEFLHTGAVVTETVTIEHLQQVARTRLCLDMAADLLVSRSSAADTQKESTAGVTAFLDSVQDLCKSSRNDWYRVYLIRKICSLNGVEYIQKLLYEDQLSWLFPQEVLQMRKDSSQIDQYLVCGVEYKAIRDGVAKAMLEGKMERIEEAIEQLAALENFIKNSKVFVVPESRDFAQALVHNQLPALQLHPNLSGVGVVVLELAVHLAAVLLCANQAVLQPLLQLAFFPANMQRAFLPTMPDDMLAVAQQAMGHLQWYYCPNGHPCTVGECGQPMEKSRCLDCKVEIGGVDHRPVQGFHALAVQGDRTQTGHILGDPQRRDQPDMQDTKNMSPAPFTLLRMLTHMAMLFGASKQPQDLTAIIKPPVPQPGMFLMGHLLKDIEQLMRTLGKGADDTVCTIHLSICSLLEPHQRSLSGPLPYDNLLSTKDARNNWEMTMTTDIITSQLKVLETQLAKVNTFIRDDERVSSNPVMKVTYGEPRLFLRTLPQGSLIHCSSVWGCRQRVSLLSLGHILEQNEGRDTLPILWKFLQKEAELRLVKFLPDILALQRDLVKKFQNVMELQCGTIAQFLQNLKAESLMTSYKKRIDVFLSTWNQLRGSLATNGEIKLPAEYCQEDLDLNSDLQVLLPRRRGLGLCSTALVSYLIALHNDLIYAVDKHTGEETSYTVSPADLTELHVIRYEVERDLLPLVLSNCQYSMECGRETLSEYDLPQIQQQLLTRFLQGKPLISLNGIPTLINRHDRNYENILQDVKGKVQQESLSSLSQSTLSVELQSYSDVCEALSTVEVALGFLAMTGGEPNMQLGDYLKEELQMADHIALLVFKDPFVGISKEYKKTLGEEEKRLLTGFFTKTSADSFLLEMHEFLLLVLKNPNATDTYKPNWSVKDTMVSYIERKDMDVPPDVEELFPDTILLAQYIEAWKFSILLKQERMQR
ncbi:hypothetical protein QTP86_010384 [Hemibagrus guttatus]|nr:hypothetical protein QTP86_010384 [Hemibagrus guttatus]